MLISLTCLLELPESLGPAILRESEPRVRQSESAVRHFEALVQRYELQSVLAQKIGRTARQHVTATATAWRDAHATTNNPPIYLSND